MRSRSEAARSAVRPSGGADDVVRAVVRHARDNGATWQVVGDAPGVTRQAAFQRYGRPIDPGTGELMTTTPLPGVAALATSVIRDLAAGRDDRVIAGLHILDRKTS